MNKPTRLTGTFLAFAVIKSAILFALGYSAASKFMQGDLATAQIYAMAIIILKMR